jgi:hypothetical protein
MKTIMKNYFEFIRSMDFVMKITIISLSAVMIGVIQQFFN